MARHLEQGALRGKHFQNSLRWFMSIMAYLGRASHIAVVRFAEPPGRPGELPRRVVFRVAVKPLLKKYSDLQKRKSLVYPLSSRPTEGRSRDRHGRGAGCDGRGGVRHDT
jgi:hypothetical protein